MSRLGVIHRKERCVRMALTMIIIGCLLSGCASYRSFKETMVDSLNDRGVNACGYVSASYLSFTGRIIFATGGMTVEDCARY